MSLKHDIRDVVRDVVDDLDLDDLIDEARAALAEARERGEALGRKLDDLIQLVAHKDEEPPAAPVDPVVPPDEEPIEPEPQPETPDQEPVPEVPAPEPEPAPDEPDEPPAPEPQPAPPGPVLHDPVSGLPFRSGFGQTMQLQALEQLRGARAGAVAAWCNHAAYARTWDQLRGGPLGKPAAREGIFSRAGAGIYHTINQQRLCDPRALRIWIVPLVPHSIDASGKIVGHQMTWPNAGVWAELADPKRRRSEVTTNWADFGRRWGHYLQQAGMTAELQVLVLGWEGTGWWYPWSIGPDKDGYLAVWRLAVDSIRAGLRASGLPAWEKVRFEFRYAGETRFVPWRPTDVHPGNGHADILGCSLHGGEASFGTEDGWREECFGTEDKPGLDVVRQMAVASGTKLGIDEWSVVRSDSGHKGHPIDPRPKAAMLRALQYLEANAADVSHECYLQATAYDLLSPGWDGQDGYLKWVRNARARVDARVKAAA